MSSKTKVSKQVKVIQGSRIIILELTKRGLSIWSNREGAFVLGKPAMDALRELLGMQQPSHIIPRSVSSTGAGSPVDEPLTLSPEEFAERFEIPSNIPPREPEGTPTPEGLTRRADGVEEGMG
jgi:hypothetical protein